MNDGVATLLERMKTNPEEFFDFGSKWAGVIGEHKDFLEAEDRQALTDGLNKLMQQRFTEQVMEELVNPKKLATQDVINRYQAKGMPSVGQTHGLYANGIGGNATLLAQQQLQVEHMKAHLEALKKEEVKEPHKTLFGRLFNYQ